MREHGNICLHITKTAGGTLKRSLELAKNLNVEFVYNKFDQEALLEKNLANVDLVYGHVIFGFGDKIKYAENVRYMCFMRHPLSRTISHYYHLRNVDKGPVGDQIRLSSDINDFFENYSHWEFSNFMTRIISGEGRAEGANEVDILAKAKDKLDTHFDFVGFQEFFSFSLRKMKENLGCDLTVENDINVGRYDVSSISEHTLQSIEQLNRQDMELYKYAIQRYL